MREVKFESGSYLSLKSDEYVLFRVIFGAKRKKHVIFSNRHHFRDKANVLVRDKSPFFDFQISASDGNTGNNFLRILKFPMVTIFTKIVAGFICGPNNEDDV